MKKLSLLFAVIFLGLLAASARMEMPGAQAQSLTPRPSATPTPAVNNDKMGGRFFDLEPFGDQNVVVLLDSVTKTGRPLLPATAPDLARARELKGLLGRAGFLAGEVRYVDSPGMLVRNPLVLADDGRYPKTEGFLLMTGAPAQFRAEAGTYALPPGTPYLASLKAAPAGVASTLTCGCPGDQPALACTAPNPRPAPGCDSPFATVPSNGDPKIADALMCPDFASMPLGSQFVNFGSTTAACGAFCPPSPALCNEPPGPDLTPVPPELNRCEMRSLGPAKLSSVCLAMGGAGENCPGFCRGDTDGSCFALTDPNLAPSGFADKSSTCQIMGAGSDGQTTVQCEGRRVDPQDLTPYQRHQVCASSPLRPDGQPSRLPGIFTSCQPINQLDGLRLDGLPLTTRTCNETPNGTGICYVCGGLLNEGCVQVERPLSNPNSDPLVADDPTGDPEQAPTGPETGTEPEENASALSEAGTDLGTLPTLVCIGKSLDSYTCAWEGSNPSAPDDSDPPSGGSGSGTGGGNGGGGSSPDPKQCIGCEPHPVSPPSPPDEVEDPINLGSEELATSATDVLFPAKGPSFSFTRSYRSAGMRSGALGPGWVHNFEDYIEPIGDWFNRAGMPDYCVSKLPTIRCLLRYDGAGGSQLFVYDAETGLFASDAGGFDVIRATKDGFFLRGPGNIVRHYNFIGKLISVKDEFGHGLELSYRMRTPEEIALEGRASRYAPVNPFTGQQARYGVAFDGLLPDGFTTLGAATTFARYELDAVKDSYARTFKFTYATYSACPPGYLLKPAADACLPEGGAGQPQNPVHRRRLAGITYRDSVLVSFDYTVLPEAREAYLTQAARRGLIDPALPPAEPLITRYEYQHEILRPGGALALDAAGQPTTAFGRRVTGLVERVQRGLAACAGGAIVPPSLASDANDPCLRTARVEGGGAGLVPPADTLLDQLRLAIADNLVRVYEGGGDVPAVETYFDPDPGSADFDRAVKQRHGALNTGSEGLPAQERDPAAQDGNPAARPGAVPDVLFTWRSRAPQATLRQALSGDPDSLPGRVSLGPGEALAPNPDRQAGWYRDGVRVPEQVLNAVPLVATRPFAVLPRGEVCREAEAMRLLPHFVPRNPAGTRADQPADLAAGAPPRIVRSRENCAAIAGRQERDAFRNETARYTGPGPYLDAAHVALAGVRRTAMEWDLARVCRWVEVENRDGVRHYYGLNFYGLPLVSAVPSPADPAAWSITLTRYNADGLAVEQTQPDGGRTQTAYLGRGSGAANVLLRALPSSVSQIAATDPGLARPVSAGLNGTETPLARRTWRYQYEPLFQQLASETNPAGWTLRYYYDYQQLRPANDRAAVTALQLGARRFGLRIETSGVASPFLGRDLDGDGLGGRERSAGLVLAGAFGDAAVHLGGGRTGEVGTRYRLRDADGALIAVARVKQAFDPAADFDRVVYRYHRDLAAAEAGSSSPTSGILGQGPLGAIEVLRRPDATGPDDRDIERYSYDALGGVRRTVRNDDPATELETVRDTLGRVVLERDAGGGETTYAYDDRGWLATEIHRDLTAAGSPQQVAVHAWGVNGTPLGVCREARPGACASFPAVALRLGGEQPRGRPFSAEALRAALPDASWEVTFTDAEDRPAGSADAAGGLLLLKRGPSGLTEAARLAAEPNPEQVTLFTYDRMGRTVQERLGDAAGDPLVTNYRYDGFGRVIAVQTQADGRFTPNTGTIFEIRYDVLDLPVASWVSGDDGQGRRRVLSLQRTEYNEAGLPTVEHTYASQRLPEVPVGLFLNLEGSRALWASEELGYDQGLRLVFNKPEGLPASTWEYDGFGLTREETPNVRLVYGLRPRQRQAIVDTTALADGPAAQSSTLRTATTADGQGRLVRMEQWDPADGIARVSTWRYDGLGQTIRSVDPGGRSVASTFDALGNLVATEEAGPDGQVLRKTAYAHDALGRLTTETDAEGQTTQNSYDRSGAIFRRVLGLGLPEPEVRSATLDAAGRVVRSTLALGTGPERAHDYRFKPGSAAVTGVSVDGQPALQFALDGLDRPVAAVDANLATPRDDPDGLLGARPVLTTTLAYDAMGRLISEQTAAGGLRAGGAALQPAVLGGVAATFGADYLGMTRLATAAGERLSFGYTPRGNVGSITRSNAAGGRAVTAGFAWQGGLLAAAGLGGPRLRVERDALGQILATLLETPAGVALRRDDVVRGPNGHVTAWRSDGRLSGAAASGYRYDGLGRFASLTEAPAGSVPPLAAFRAGRANALRNEAAGAALIPGSPAANTYNPLDGLTSAAPDAGGRSYGAAYDAGLPGHPPQQVNGSPIQQDSLRRIRSDGNLIYVYDVFDRLAGVFRPAASGPGAELVLAYDGLGRRRVEVRREPAAGGASVLRAVALQYAGNNVIEEDDLAGGGIVATITHLPGSVDAPVLFSPGPTGRAGVPAYALGADARGDVVAAADLATGTLAEEVVFTAWGERTFFKPGAAACAEGAEAGTGSLPASQCAPSSPILARWGLAGARQHPLTKLVDLRNRVYATHLRLFLTSDPLGSVDSYGLWNYAAGDPINFRDPFGLDNEPAAVTPSEEPGGSITSASDIADIWDRQAEKTEQILTDMVHEYPNTAPVAALVMTAVDVGKGAMDNLRLGQGAAEGGWRGIGKDVLRGVGIVSSARPGIKQIGAIGSKVGRLIRLIGQPCSFGEDTPVETDHGSVPISKVRVGDRVLAYDPLSGDVGFFLVTEVVAHEDPSALVLQIDGESLLTTPDHPFYSPMLGWIPAAELKPGSMVQRSNGGYGTVEVNRSVVQSRRLWNLSVEGAHTFFVGDGEWLVHNGCNPLRNALGTAAGWQAHHLIPQAFTQHPYVQLAIAGGFNMHGVTNGISLPGNQLLGLVKNMAYHSGYHGQYSSQVQTVLNRLSNLAAANNWSAAHTAKVLTNYAASLRKQIQALPAGTRLQ